MRGTSACFFLLFLISLCGTALSSEPSSKGAASIIGLKSWILQEDIDGSGAPSPGDVIRYSISLNNDSPDPLMLSVEDTIPDQAQSWSMVHFSGGIDASTPGVLGIEEIPLLPSGTAEIVFDLVIAEDGPGGSMVNTARYTLEPGGETGVMVAPPVVMGGGTSVFSGQWNGVWWDEVYEYATGIMRIQIIENSGWGTATVDAPGLQVFSQALPLVVNGDTITIGDPEVLGFEGILVNGGISGELYRNSVLDAAWQVLDEGGGLGNPGSPPGLACDGLPSMMCLGNTDYCGEIVAFEPDTGLGYFDFPNGGETAEDQIYSYLRRDLIQLIKYAAAKVACKTADWGYGSSAPLALADMSEADGSTPGSSTGMPRHPLGSHEGGRDIDTAYYQLYSPDNFVRPPGDHHSGTTDAYHLTEEPYGLDRWRTALFVAYLSEHPGLRVIGVDGQVGLLLESALDDLVSQGWIDPTVRASVPLAYEVTDGGAGWYLFHHQFMHISMSAGIAGVGNGSGSLPGLVLFDSYPNPFNPQTTIAFDLPKQMPVSLRVFDVSGRLVDVLLDDFMGAQGRNEVVWRGRDVTGRVAPAGVYFYRLEAGEYSETKRMTLLK